MKKSILIIVMGLMMVSMMAAVQAALTCDDVITTDITLTEDVICEDTGTYYGLLIGASDITIDGNGHTISMPNRNNVIVGQGANNVVIKNLIIAENPYSGISLTGNNNKVQDVTIEGYGVTGVFFNGEGNTVENIVARDRVTAISIWGQNNLIQNNILDGTGTRGTYGIAISTKGSNKILNNKISDRAIGILLQTSKIFENKDEIRGNIVQNALSSAIYTQGAAVISGNDVSHSVTGFRLEGGNAVTIENNNAFGTGTAIYAVKNNLEIDGSDGSNFDDTTNIGINLNGNDNVIRNLNLKGGTGTGISFRGNNNRIEFSTISDKALGIAGWYLENSVIDSVTVYSAGTGIQFNRNKGNNVVSNSVIHGAKGNGLWTDGAEPFPGDEIFNNEISASHTAINFAGPNNRVHNNVITDSRDGVWLQKPSGTAFYQNNVYNNQRYDLLSSETIELSQEGVGNYWGNPEEPCFRGTSVGDVSTDNAVDSYPFCEPNGWEAPQGLPDKDEDGFAADVDCNDDNAAVYPGAPEVLCNDLDEDCDGLDSYGVDEDNDGYYLDGELCGAVDCDDVNPTVNPGATELACDNADNNCNGLVDESNSAPVIIFDIKQLDLNADKSVQKVLPVGQYEDASFYEVHYEVLDDCGTESESLILSACGKNVPLSQGDTVVVRNKPGNAADKNGKAFDCTVGRTTVDIMDKESKGNEKKQSIDVVEIVNGDGVLTLAIGDDHGLSSTTSYKLGLDGVEPIDQRITGQVVGGLAGQQVLLVVAIVAIFGIVAMTFNIIGKKK